MTLTASGDIIKTKHTKSGKTSLWCEMGDRVDRDTYNQINAHAKAGRLVFLLQGRWRRAGFQFRMRPRPPSFVVG